MGFSFLQGPHQDAQKSISTNFPLSEDNFSCFPVLEFSIISGALLPILIPAVTLLLDPACVAAEIKINIIRPTLKEFNILILDLLIEFNLLSNYFGTKGIQTQINIFISSVNLFNIINC